MGSRFPRHHWSALDDRRRRGWKPLRSSRASNVAARFGCTLHKHSREDEYSFVLEGKLGALLGEEVVFVAPAISSSDHGTNGTRFGMREMRRHEFWRSSRRLASRSSSASWLPQVASLKLSHRLLLGSASDMDLK